MAHEFPVLITKEEAFIALSTIESKYNYLLEYADKNNIFLCSGHLGNVAYNVSIFTAKKAQPFDAQQEIEDEYNWDFFIEKLNKDKPDYIMLEPIRACSNVKFTEPFFAYKYRVKLPKPKKQELLDELNKIWELFQYKNISFRVYAFYTQHNLCLQYVYISNLYRTLAYYECTEDDFLLMEVVDYENALLLEEEEELKQKEDEEKEAEEERLEQFEYEKRQKEHEEFIAPYIEELSNHRELGLTKNKDQRYAVTKKFFGKRFNKIEQYSEQIARAAIDKFEFEKLPELVKNLKLQQKTEKQISDELGVALPKIKKIYAIL